MTVWVVTYYHDIVEICDSKQKAMNVIEKSLEEFAELEIFSQSEIDEILRDLRKNGNSWNYHIKRWEVY